MEGKAEGEEGGLHRGRGRGRGCEEGEERGGCRKQRSVTEREREEGKRGRRERVLKKGNGRDEE